MKTENQYQEQPNTCIIVNPVFNAVFKRLMKNERIAKFFLSTIIDRCTKIMDMKLTIKIILCFILMFDFVSVFGQDSLSSKKLCKDVKYAFSFIRKEHINPYAYTDKKIIDSTEQTILKKLKERTKWSLLDFNRIVNIATNALFDGHTFIGYNLFFQPWKVSSDSSLYFPCEVEVDGNIFYLITDEQKLKIQSINEYVAEDILKYLQQCFPADMSLSGKNRVISLFFSLYYTWLYPECEIFEITAVNTDMKMIKMSLKGKPKEEIMTNIISKLIPSSIYEKDYCLDFYPNNIALLTINSFQYNLEEDYISFLSKSFKEITERQCKYLFIDITHNGGGSDNNANFLLDYLFENNYKIFGVVYERRVSKNHIKQYRKQNKMEYLKGLKSDYSKHFNNTKYVIYFTFHERIKDILHPFIGTVFLIQGYYTGSAALTISSAIKTSRRGILIGEPTGHPADLYAEHLIDKLPYSKLPITCAISHAIFSSGSSHDKWIEPDIYLDLDKTELNEQTLNNLIEQCKKEYPHFFKYIPDNANERETE